MQSNMKADSVSLFARPWFGNLFTFLGALAAYALCISLPLVGRAGAETTHYGLNFLTFLGILVLAIIFSCLGWYAKCQRRKSDQSPYPWIAAGFTCFYLLLLVVLLLGGLKI